MKKQSGLSLVEIIVTIVIIGISLSSIVGSFVSSSTGAVSPMINQQSIFIADGYLAEALTRQAFDPSFSSLAEDTGCETGETDRSMYDDVMDYGCIDDSGAVLRDGTAITGLSAYNVKIDTSACTLDTLDCVLITVKVTHSAGNDISLSARKMVAE